MQELVYALGHRSPENVQYNVVNEYSMITVLNSTLSAPSQQNRREKRVLILVMLFLTCNIYFVYYVFQEQQLHNW